MENQEHFDQFPGEDQQFTEEMMMQEELSLMQQSGMSDLWEESPVQAAPIVDLVPEPSHVPGVPKDAVIEPIEDEDVTVESGTKSFQLPAIFGNPKVKWTVIALIVLFAIWLVTSGVLWAIIKFIFSLVVGLVVLAVVIYFIYDWFF